MASSLINNVIQVYFDSVLGMEHEGMVAMFEALLLSRLSGFLGCSSAIYEASLVKFFHNASVRDGKVVSTVQGKPVSISEELFAGTCELPLEGLTDFPEVQKDLVFEARNAFSYDERGYAVQICILLKNAPDLELGESKEFPPLKILTAKTFGTYIAKNNNIFVDEDEPAVEKPAEKKKAGSKNRPATTVEAPVAKKKKTTVEKAAPTDKNLGLVTVAQDVEPITTVPAVNPRASRHRAPKRKFVLQTGSDDEIVDSIIHQVIADTAAIETEEPAVEESEIMRSAEIDIEGYERSTAEKKHKLEWTRPYSSHMFEGYNVQPGVFIPRSNMKFKSTCWIIARILVDGSWLIVEGVDYWRPISRPNDSHKWEMLPQRPYIDDLAPLFAFVEPVQDLDSRSPFSRLICGHWTGVCVAVVQFSLLEFLRPVGTVNRCREIIGPVVDIEEPAVQTLFSSSSGSTIYRSPSTRSDSFSQCHLDSVTADPIVQIETIQNPVPTASDSFSQHNPDTFFNSPSQRTSADSRMLFTTDEIPLDVDDKFKGVQDQQAALSHDLMEFRVQAQENFNTLTSQLSELVDYINRGGDAKKGKVVEAEVRSLLLMIMADLVPVMKEADLEEIVGADL
ncbi:hypothetical protein F511_35589 [Dorcoceras hygrometricum]|uniref:Splicing factor 3B subunit 1-like n=1 Tax=Dorcoceras hygrometricum TaxID=472368 RepID=A0A2Z7AAW4_9LAMI|nr:hypothetical protein F511_35589 [Dorcoceras hygrometricum]